MMKNARISTTTTAARRMNPIRVFRWKQRARAITQITGTGRIIWMALVRAI